MARAGLQRWRLIITVVACILALVRPLQPADTLRFGVMVVALMNWQTGASAQARFVRAAASCIPPWSTRP